MLLDIELKGNEKKCIIYDNQDKCSLEIVDKLHKNKKIISIMVIALTQSGKTTTMVALIKNYMIKNLIDPQNIYI